jgi:hypothetical protein
MWIIPFNRFKTFKVNVVHAYREQREGRCRWFEVTPEGRKIQGGCKQVSDRPTVWLRLQNTKVGEVRGLE